LPTEKTADSAPEAAPERRERDRAGLRRVDNFGG
jgi:hypothetical protein